MINDIIQYLPFSVWLISLIIIPTLVAQTVRSLPTVQETQVLPLGWKIPWGRKWQLTPVFLPWELHGRRSLEGYSPWIAKSWTWLSNCHFTSLISWGSEVWPPLPTLGQLSEQEICPDIRSVLQISFCLLFSFVRLILNSISIEGNIMWRKIMFTSWKI